MLRIEVTAVRGKLDDKLQRYITKKLSGLDKYLPRHARGSAHAEVKLSASKIDGKPQYVCEVILHVPIENITISETTVNMYAAVDIAEAKLRNAIRKYKETHDTPRLHRRILARFRRRSAE